MFQGQHRIFWVWNTNLFLGINSIVQSIFFILLKTRVTELYNKSVKLKFRPICFSAFGPNPRNELRKSMFLFYLNEWLYDLMKRAGWPAFYYRKSRKMDICVSNFLTKHLALFSFPEKFDYITKLFFLKLTTNFSNKKVKYTGFYKIVL